MAEYWPTPEAEAADPVVAHLMNSLPKVVFSRTLRSADWTNTRLIRENVAEEIHALKMQAGRDLAVFGSANLLSSLVALDLVDEHRVMVNPVLIGEGTPLFSGLESTTNLTLLETRVFASGNGLGRRW